MLGRFSILALATLSSLVGCGSGGVAGAAGSGGALASGADGPTSGPSAGPATTAGQSTSTSSGGGWPPPAESGRATYYDADGSGNCSFDPSPNDLDVAAMDAAEYAGSAVCGECVAVTGPNGSVTVRIVDQCPGCEAGHLDLSKEAFAKIADPAAGNVPITWSVVPCAVTGNVAYRFKEGSSQWWTAIQVRNHRVPIASLAWKNGGAWQPVTRQDYNYFVIDSGVGTTGQFDVQITGADGQVLDDTLPGVIEAQVDPGSGQFQ